MLLCCKVPLAAVAAAATTAGPQQHQALLLAIMLRAQQVNLRRFNSSAHPVTASTLSSLLSGKHTASNPGVCQQLVLHPCVCCAYVSERLHARSCLYY